MKRHFWISLILISIVMLLPTLVRAQEPTTEILAETVESQFRQQITARLVAEHSAEISEIEFFYRVVGQRATSRNVAEFEPGTTIEASFNIEQDRQETYMPPGTEFEYWWRLTDVDGNVTKTEPQFYLYMDNRFDFKTLSNDRITLYWYNGSRTFGDRLFEQAKTALNRLETEVGVSLDQPIKIFIYGSHQDLISALSTSAQEWTGGVAFTDYGVVVIGIAADNLDWGLGAMTHELTHLIIHQATDNPYGDLPRWLDEGLAVYNENPDSLDEQFRETFSEAVKTDSLMTLQTLSSSFPADPDAANLAYGQSGVVVAFIIREYGGEAMAKLLDIFSEGALYDNALEEALGENTQSLDNAFRASVGLDPLPGTEPAPAQPDDSATEPDTAESSDRDPEPAQSDDQASASDSTADEPESEPAAESRSSRRLSCLGGMISLAALGGVVVQRRRNLYL
jgi:hypothetical protein